MSETGEVLHAARRARQEAERRLRGAVQARKNLGRGQAHLIPTRDAAIANHQEAVAAAKAEEQRVGADRARFG